MATHLDAAALRARVREAGAGTLKLDGFFLASDAVTFGGAELAGALAAEGAGLTGLKVAWIKLGADGWRAVSEALRKGACPQLATLKLAPDPGSGSVLQAAPGPGPGPLPQPVRVRGNQIAQIWHSRALCPLPQKMPWSLATAQSLVHAL